MDADAIAKHIGARLKRARLAADLSQSELGAAMGISFQQVQKYELGINRIGAAQLFSAAKKLGRPLADFLPAQGAHKNDEALDAALATPEGVRLMRAFAKLETREAREAAAYMAEALAETEARARRK